MAQGPRWLPPLSPAMPQKTENTTQAGARPTPHRDTAGEPGHTQAPPPRSRGWAVPPIATLSPSPPGPTELALATPTLRAEQNPPAPLGSPAHSAAMRAWWAEVATGRGPSGLRTQDGALWGLTQAALALPPQGGGPAGLQRQLCPPRPGEPCPLTSLGAPGGLGKLWLSLPAQAPALPQTLFCDHGPSQQLPSAPLSPADARPFLGPETPAGGLLHCPRPWSPEHGLLWHLGTGPRHSPSPAAQQTRGLDDGLGRPGPAPRRGVRPGRTRRSPFALGLPPTARRTTLTSQRCRDALWPPRHCSEAHGPRRRAVCYGRAASTPPPVWPCHAEG